MLLSAYGAGGAMESVRQIRKERGWSQEKTAIEAGINKVTLVHIETGQSSPNVETLQKLANAFAVEVADFFPKAQAPLPFERDAEWLFEEEALQAKRRAMELLRAWRAFIDRTVRRWEASPPTAAQVRDVLDALEPMVEGRVFEPAFGGLVGTFTEEERFELDMLHKGVGRLRVAAKDAIADFRSIDGMGAA
jgi:transcriptional regulator with XRE-family HTH domain